MEIITYSEARARRLKRYFTGKPCKHGHIAERNFPAGMCLECARAHSACWTSANRAHCRDYLRKWNEDNRERANKRRRRYEANNPDYMARERARSRQWAAKNHEHLKEYRRTWATENPERERTYIRNKRARRRGNGGKHTPEEIAEILELQGGKCAVCRRVITPKNQTVDHIIASINGGRNDRSNLQILCRACNSRKGTKDPVEFMRAEAVVGVVGHFSPERIRIDQNVAGPAR
jgi:5-methylcytosine-specific restriction endonuclease McrA